MSNARNLARLLPNTSGQLPDANLAAIAAGKVAGQLVDANMSSGSVLQVVQGTLSTQYYRSSSNGWASCGLEASITPSSTTSKILVIINTSMGSDSNHNMLACGLMRNGSYLAAQRQLPGVDGTYGYALERDIVHLDSPSSTSTLTYALGTNDLNSDGANCWVNRRMASTTEVTGVSTITLLEIAG